MTNKQIEELADFLGTEAFLAARKLPGITDAMAYAVKDRVLEKAKDLMDMNESSAGLVAEAAADGGWSAPAGALKKLHSALCDSALARMRELQPKEPCRHNGGTTEVQGGGQSCKLCGEYV